MIQSLLKTGKYQFRVFGGAVKHANYNTIKVNEDFIIAPVDGFGDPMKLRLALASEKPDAILLFTDPRFFIWIFEMEDEVHDVCPIAYNHIWDEEPYPSFNEQLYEATDLINCISWKTYELVSPHFPEKTNYIPHALSTNVFKKLPKYERREYKKQLLGDTHVNSFVGLWINRNARRKRPGDLLISWKLFLENLQENHGHKNAVLIVHTDPLDSEGPNLYKQIEMLGIVDNVFISKEKLDFEKMNVLHNVSDFCINVSNAEGFGLATLEALYTGTPIIATKTGGLTRQVENPETGEQYGVGMDPDLRTMVGSQTVPFIMEDHVRHDTIANAINKLFELGNDGREELGLRGQAYAHKAFNLEALGKAWDETLEKCILDYKANQDKPRYKMTTL